MSTSKQDKEFESIMKSHVETTIDIGNAALDEAIDYIGNEFNPEDVFDETALEHWAERNGYTKS